MMNSNRLRFSSKTVALGYISISLAILAVFSLTMAYFWNSVIEKDRIVRIHEDAQRLIAIYNASGQEQLDKAIHVISDDVQGTNQRFVFLADPSHQRLLGNLSAWPEGLTDQSAQHERWFAINGKQVRAVFSINPLPDQRILVVGRDTSRFHLVEMIFWFGLAGASCVIVISGLTGHKLIRAALLAEINRISHTTSAIIGGDLTRRLPRHSDETELDMLAATVNRTLDQIEQLIHSYRQVSDSIAHDLRTPLAELRFRLESLTLGTHPIEHIYNEIDAAIIDVDRVILVFNALLRLAEIDHGARRSGFQPVDIVSMTNDVADFYRPLAELKQIALTVESSAAVTTVGDALLLAQAVGNLVDNALKYTQNAVSITVNKQRDNQVSIRVTDDGIGISDDDKPRVTERFYRGNTSRDTDGVGLGLSLVVAVAKLHGGALELSDAHPGLNATLHIQIQT